jgi:hypothetical protein
LTIGAEFQILYEWHEFIYNSTMGDKRLANVFNKSLQAYLVECSKEKDNELGTVDRVLQNQ